MHKLEELKEMLCDELEEYGDKGKLDVGGLEIVDKLAHAIKNIDKIIEMSDGEYSSAYIDGRRVRESRDGYDGGSYRRSYERGRSYRNSMRRSRGGDMVAELYEIMEDAPNDRIRKEVENLIHKVDGMM